MTTKKNYSELNEVEKKNLLDGLSSLTQSRTQVISILTRIDSVTVVNEDPDFWPFISKESIKKFCKELMKFS